MMSDDSAAHAAEVAALREELAEAQAARTEAEQRLAETWAFQQLALDAMPYSFWVKDLEGRYLVVNTAFCAFHGLPREAIIGHTAEDLFEAEKAGAIRKGDDTTLASEQVYRSEVPFPNAAGSVRWIETLRNTIRSADGAPVGLVGTTRDVSDRVAAEADRLAMERALHETQRHESLGLLAGGIAHDFNNLLTSILGHTELALLDGAATQSIRNHLDQIVGGARMAARLAGQLLAYAGKSQVHPQPVGLNQLTQTMADLIRVSLPKAARLHYELSPDLPMIEGDLAQLQQVVLNLLTNAADALDGEDGDLLLRTGHAQLSTSELHSIEPTARLTAGHYVRLEVQDSGRGMDQATIGRIFDPFFSTKGTGRGLGLAAVRGIVQSHRGLIHVQSVPGAGTRVTIWFPALAVKPQAHTDAPETDEVLRQPRTILLIDDELNVRQVTARMLERLGYLVVTAPDGESGLALLADGIIKPDLVLLDLTMPGIGGSATAWQINLRHPDLPIVLISGYQADEVSAGQENLITAGFIQKPFTLDTLRKALKEVL